MDMLDPGQVGEANPQDPWLFPTHIDLVQDVETLQT